MIDYYAEALELSGYNALALKAMCEWAFLNRKNKEAMRAASEVWGRNARLFGKAWILFAGDELSVDEILKRVYVAKLKDIYLATRLVKDTSLTYWELRAKVDEQTRKSSAPRESLADKCWALVDKWNDENKTSEYISGHPNELEDILPKRKAEK